MNKTRLKELLDAYEAACGRARARGYTTNAFALNILIKGLFAELLEEPTLVMCPTSGCAKKVWNNKNWHYGPHMPYLMEGPIE